MKIYLVGGAVRDELLKRPIKERDWVVIGSTPSEMRKKGFKPVGKDFPVFLHPKTHEEYALARTERKISKGYKGFQFYTAKNVTLEDDLIRRDLTINAIAKDSKGHLIDPYHGQEDLKKKLLHHVSPAFAEDPVRILRVARFACKLPGFKIHPTTLKLMKKMVKEGEVNALVAERVWQEFAKALGEAVPYRFFEVLKDCAALSILFPEFKPLKKHLENLKNAVKINEKPTIRFAALCAYLKLDKLNFLCKRYCIPNEFKELATLAVKFYQDYIKIIKKDAHFILNFLTKTDAFRREKRFKQFLIVCKVIDKKSPHKKIQKLLVKSLAAAKSVNTKRLQTQKLKGLKFAHALKNLQQESINKVL